MAILPVKRIPAIESIPMSTCATIFKGQVVTWGGAGYVTNTVSGYGTGVSIAGVAAEQKATNASLSTSTQIKIWPADPNTIWEAAASGTAAQAGVGQRCFLQNAARGVQYSATAVGSGNFLITEIVTSSKVRGKLVNTNGRALVPIGGAG